MDDVINSMEQTLNATPAVQAAVVAENGPAAETVDQSGDTSREVKSLQARLSAVTEADRGIIEAERHCAACESVYEDLKQQAAEAKKRFDAAVEAMREKIRARATGLLQPRLDFGEADPQPEPVADAPKPAGGRKGRKSKANATAEQEPGAAPTAESVSRGEDEESEAPIVDAAGPSNGIDPILDVPLNAVSVMDGDKMTAIPASMIMFLADAGINTVRAAVDALDSGKKIPGVGNTGRAKLTAIMKAWRESGGGEERIPSAAETPKSPEAGEPTGKLCADCRTPAKLDDKKCPSCDSDELHKVGYYGAAGCDQDGDFVNAEELAFTITTGALTGTSAAVMISEHNGWRGGYEIKDDKGNVIASHYPNITDKTFPERGDCLRQWAYALDLAAEKYCENGKQLKAFRAAAKDRLGVDVESKA